MVIMADSLGTARGFASRIDRWRTGSCGGETAAGGGRDRSGHARGKRRFVLRLAKDLRRVTPPPRVARRVLLPAAGSC
jgi:hypothetical protein